MGKPTPRWDSHQNSVQNGPVDAFTALTGTIFVTISVFRSQGHFWAIFLITFRQLYFSWNGPERIFFSERKGTDFTENVLFGNGMERNGTVHP